jgi:hypothetical protein
VAAAGVTTITSYADGTDCLLSVRVLVLAVFVGGRRRSQHYKTSD